MMLINVKNLLKIVKSMLFRKLKETISLPIKEDIKKSVLYLSYKARL